MEAIEFWIDAQDLPGSIKAVRRASAESTLVRLPCVDDVNQGQPLDLLVHQNKENFDPSEWLIAK